MVSLNKGGHDVIIPEHVDPYIWKEVGSGDCIVIIEVAPPIHIKDRRTYELILVEGSYVMDMSTPLCRYLTRRKNLVTYRGVEPDMRHIRAQYIDHRGKCVSVMGKGKKEVRCHCRPLRNNTYEPWKGVIMEHLDYMNRIRGPPIVKWESSCSKYLFFPEEESFLMWYNSVK